MPDWYGIRPDRVAHLIARYTRDGDAVLDADAHLTIAAAEYLGRRSAIAVVRRPQTTRHDSTPSTADSAGPHTGRLDSFTASRVDRRAHPAPAANADTSGGIATHPRPTPDHVERTAAPCPPNSHPTPGHAQPDTTPTASDPQAGSSATAGRR
ncbi:hypothetical protein [Krasilnikovia sp. M28-CT-15]|uniref:hypothetical protein n=1 Tax=Krasilnikovia sp. M28-CT-15 TaxID=3373540 RepID=UPI003876FF89